MTTAPDREHALWPPARTVLCTVLAVAAIETLFLFTGASGVRHGVLIDPDCYMHLQRAYRLMTGGWQSSGFDPRVNAPFGYAIHWTVLFDALLAAGALPLTWLGVEAHRALYLWGSLISPLLLIAALAVFQWGVRPWVRGPFFLWLVLLLFTQPQLSGSFLVGRADHHSLILGLMLVELAWLYAALDGRAGEGARGLGLALLAGMGAGMELCTTVEGLLTLLLISVVLGIAWVWRRHYALKVLAAYWAGSLAITLAWLILTRWPVFFQPAYDRVSIVHASILAIGAMAILLAMLLNRVMPRAAALALSCAGAACVTGLIYPDFFLGPWPHLDPWVKTWHREIGELQPLLPDNLFHAGQFLGAFAASLIALPFAVQRLLLPPSVLLGSSPRKTSSPASGFAAQGKKAGYGETGERFVMLAALCGFCLFGTLSLVQMRWSGEMQAVMLLPWTLTTRRIMQSSIALKLPVGRVPLRSAFLMAALFLQVTPSAFAGTRSGRVPPSSAACDWDQAARALGRLPRQHGMVMTELWYGPDILWRSRFDVVGAPYEIAPAIADSLRFEKGTLQDAREVLARRHVDYVLQCGPRAGAKALRLEPVAFAVPGFHFYRVR